MKLFSTILAVVAMTALTACSKDNDSDSCKTAYNEVVNFENHCTVEMGSKKYYSASNPELCLGLAQQIRQKYSGTQCSIDNNDGTMTVLTFDSDEMDAAVDAFQPSISSSISYE